LALFKMCVSASVWPLGPVSRTAMVLPFTVSFRLAS
jgi:hypothetical protein